MNIKYLTKYQGGPGFWREMAGVYQEFSTF